MYCEDTHSYPVLAALTTKPMSLSQWNVNDEFERGSHSPMIVFMGNRSARSEPSNKSRHGKRVKQLEAKAVAWSSSGWGSGWSSGWSSGPYRSESVATGQGWSSRPWSSVVTDKASSTSWSSNQAWESTAWLGQSYRTNNSRTIDSTTSYQGP